MGIPSRKSVHARHRDGPHRRHDPRKAPPERRDRAGRLLAGLIACVVCLATSAPADTLRIALYHAELSRDGPGLLLRDILTGQDPQVEAAAKVIAVADPDVLVLLGFDYDFGSLALAAFADRLAADGRPYPHRVAWRPNTGMPTGLDLDGDGHLGDATDAQGFGRFSGEGGMAVLSRLPLGAGRDFSALLWRDLPGALLPDMPPDVAAVQRLSTTGHWEVPVMLPKGGALGLLMWHASPPVFDGPEDRNGRRNHDETAFWLRLLDGVLPFDPPEAPFVLLGDANLDPARSEGRPDALAALLADPRVQDVAPTGAAGNATADFTARNGPGRMRVDYILPAAGLRVTDSGVIWPAADDPLLAVAEAASRHRLLWVDLDLP